jgi:hypothetical protein
MSNAIEAVSAVSNRSRVAAVKTEVRATDARGVREAVGILRGAISGNVKISF